MKNLVSRVDDVPSSFVRYLNSSLITQWVPGRRGDKQEKRSMLVVHRGNRGEREERSFPTHVNKTRKDKVWSISRNGPVSVKSQQGNGGSDGIGGVKVVIGRIQESLCDHGRPVTGEGSLDPGIEKGVRRSKTRVGVSKRVNYRDTMELQSETDNSGGWG